ncbi:U3 small nucleolar RNA-associated protein 14 [Euphorbia lathyris]|uniref:U3 small nucleolar RNA-associated protein 14 n=1 Tax=Euphorbia lathyris TaxID=212925 RepID=UPI003313C773
MDRKRKARNETNQKMEKGNKKWKSKSSGKKTDMKNQRKTGPRLPASLLREVDRRNPNNQFDSDEEIDSDEGRDFYEYEEEVAEEESKKNRRYDRVENYEYKLPEKFKDENVLSDDDGEDENNDYNTDVKRKNIGQLDDDVEEEDDEKHLRMLQGITGMPTEAFEGKKRNKNAVMSEAYPESEYNPSHDVLDGDGRISIDELLGSLQDTSNYHQLRKRMEKNSAALHAPLAKGIQDKVDRKVAYDLSKKDVTKWEPIVKRNREAPSIIFDRDIDLGFSTLGAIASEFEPRTEFEKKMASLVYDPKVMEAHKEDGARLLELNKLSAEDVREKLNHFAKMRSLLFRHEVKMKRVKKIKSKVYRRLLKKDRSKMSSDGMYMDPEEAKEQAMKQEFKRAEERMTLKHKNRSKWAARILERGLSIQDEGTRAAVAEQLHQHALLTRKMNSMRDGSSDDSSDEDEENSDDPGHDGQLNILTKAKEKTLKVLEEDDEVPNSGVLSLPFMVRGLKKKKEQAVEEAKLALQEYESSSQQLENAGGEENAKVGSVSGRRVFGGTKVQVNERSNRIPSYNIDGNSDSEHEFRVGEDFDNIGRINTVQKDVNINSVLLSEGSGVQQGSMLKSCDDIAGETGPKTAYEVSIFVSDSWKKMKSNNEEDTETKKSPKVIKHVVKSQDVEEASEESDADSEGQMVDEVLSSDRKDSYRLPSQEELIREAFAGDNVEEEFMKDKEELLNEENPEPEKPVLLPGWGQWTHVQKKKGVPSWMLEEHETAKKKREEALKKRKDAHLKHAIISEKLDKKTEKLHTKSVPYPFTIKEVYEQSIRKPIGPESNPATVVGALNRPEVVKKPGLIIKPIKFEDVDPYEREEHKSNGPKHKPKANSSHPKPKANKSRPKMKPVVAKS